MATQYWLNTAADGDWSNATNWTSAVPVSNDTVIFNGASSTDSVTTGLSQGAIDLDLLFIGDDYTGDIGSSGTRLAIDADKIVHRGKGSLYCDFTTAGVTDEIIIAHTGTQQNVAFDVTNADPTRVTISRGRVVMVLTGSVADFSVSFVDNRANDANVTLSGSGNAAPMMTGGTLAYGCSGGGSAQVSGGAVLTNTAATGSPKLDISGGGVVNWNNPSTAVAEANIYDGTLDFTQTRTQKTATLVHLWPDGDFKYFPDLTTRTVKEWDGTTSDIG